MRVLNIGYNSDTVGQDLLTIVSDGGTTLALLGLALAGLGAWRRGFRA